MNIFFLDLWKKVVYKKIWKNIDFGKKFAIGRWILGRMVGSGGRNGGFGPPKRGRNGILGSDSGFCAVRDPPLGVQKLVIGVKNWLVGWKNGQKMVKNEKKPWCWPFGGGGAPKPELGARFLEVKFIIFAFFMKSGAEKVYMVYKNGWLRYKSFWWWCFTFLVPEKIYFLGKKC